MSNYPSWQSIIMVVAIVGFVIWLSIKPKPKEVEVEEKKDGN